MDERIMEELRLHGEAMAGEGPQSPLLQIREKELEIRGRVMEAQKKAEKVVADSRARAAKMVEEAARDAERAASEAHEAGVAALDDEVAKLATSQEAETKAMVASARKRVKDAVDAVMEVVVP